MLSLDHPKIAPVVEIKPPGDKYINRGDFLFMSCDVIAGYPSPSLEWKRLDGKPFSSRIQQIVMVGGSPSVKLSIQGAELSDFGAYECIAKNSLGEVTSAINVIQSIIFIILV